jgi:hypothetical protein
MIEAVLCNNPHPNIDYRVLDIEQVACINDFVPDAITAHWCLHWVRDKRALLRLLHSISHSGALLLISTCQQLPDLLADIDVFLRKRLHIDQDSPFFFVTQSEWEDLLQDYGWIVSASIVKDEPHSVTVGPEFLRHWYAASSGAALYSLSPDELPAEVIRELTEFLNERYCSASNTWTFVENALFIVACRDR